jgi:nucleotide-binding universal stress UspA family protein
MQLKNFFRRAAHPFFLSRLQYPYDGIIASLNCPDPAYALELGIDLSRLFRVSFHAVYCTMPRELGRAAEETLLKKRYELVADFESIYKKNIPFTVREGNPVRETLTFAQEHPHNLLVLLYDRKDRFSVFNPHVPYYIAKKSPLSTLLIPVEAVYES